jgi:hypothetical protein
MFDHLAHAARVAARAIAIFAISPEASRQLGERRDMFSRHSNVDPLIGAVRRFDSRRWKTTEHPAQRGAHLREFVNGANRRPQAF